MIMMGKSIRQMWVNVLHNTQTSNIPNFCTKQEEAKAIFNEYIRRLMEKKTVFNIGPQWRLIQECTSVIPNHDRYF